MVADQNGADDNQSNHSQSNHLKVSTYEEFAKLFNVQQLDESPETQHFRLPSADLNFKNLYGGQVFSQAVFLTARVAEKRGMVVHSCHCFFVRPGNAHQAIEFALKKIGEGKTYQRYQVTACQQTATNSRLIFQAMVSTQLPESAFVRHQLPMPKVAGPDNLPSEHELRKKISGAQPSVARPLTIRMANTLDLVMPQAVDAQRGFWFKYVWPVPLLQESIEQSLLNQALLAYASDYGFLATVLMPHGLLTQPNSFFMTSLDHSMWFYNNYDPNKWCFFDCDTPIADHGRGIVYGRMYQDEQLIAVVFQEGLLRSRSA